MKKNGNGLPPTLAELRAQRDDLAGRLAAVGGQLARLDPVNNWELVSRALAEQQALERAVAALAERIETAEAAEAAAAREELAAAAAERRRALDAHALEIGRQIAEQAMAWRDGLLADLAEAQRDLARTGGILPSPVAPALVISRAIDQALGSWRGLAPTWLGLPPAPTPRERAIAETRDALERAEARESDLKRLSSKQRYTEPGEHVPYVPPERLAEATAIVASLRRRLAELQAAEA